MQPSLLAVEAARIFDAEVSALVGVFASRNCAWKVLSNDPFWANSSWPTKEMISATIDEFDPTFVHFALHGSNKGLILKLPEIADAESVLSWSSIETMPCWKGRVVITGACGILLYSDAFIKAGALATVAPEQDITWDRLCHFFRIFYSNLFNGQSLLEALSGASQHGNGYYKEYTAFGILGNDKWAIPEFQK